MAIPEVRIHYAYLLDPLYQRLHELDPTLAGKPYPTGEDVMR